MTTSGSPPASLLAQCQMPMPAVQCAVAGFHAQPLRCGVLASDDDIDVVPTAQAVIHDGEQAVRIRRQIDAHDGGFFVHDDVDEAWGPDA